MFHDLETVAKVTPVAGRGWTACGGSLLTLPKTLKRMSES
jgi:hypothetical protein